MHINTLWGTDEDNWLIAVSRKLALFAIATSVAFLLWRYATLPPLVPLWYGKPWGQDRLAHPLWLILLPLGSAISLIINTVASRTVTRDFLIFNQILALTALLIAVLSLVTLTKIVFLVA